MSDRPNIYLDNADSLSTVLSRLQLSAEVYVNGDFCGAWAVDTSGSRRIPFHLVGRGEAWLHMEGQPAQRLSSGDLVLFPRDNRHTLASSSEPPPAKLVNAGITTREGQATNLVCGFFEFQSKASWPLLDSLSPVIALSLSDFSSAPRIRTLIDLIIAELEHQSPGHYAAVNQLAYLLFIHIIRHQISTGKVKTGMLAAMFDHRIGKALAAIHNNPQQRWTLETLAGEAAMGRSSFARRFNELAGMPPMQYLTEWRMQHATALLKTTTASLLETSSQCGYESEAAFRKMYKKVIGKAPGGVRRSD